MIGTKQVLKHLSKNDKRLKALMKKVGTLDFERQSKRTVYEMLARAIANQQLHGKAAQTILNRFQALTPGKGFPKPAEVLKLSETSMRGVGFSWAKVAALKDLAQKMEDGVLPSRAKLAKMSDDEIVEALTQVRGIGRWTVEMLLIFQLGRHDVWPVDDFGVRAGFQVFMGLKDHPKPKQLAEHGEIWKPYRTTVALYMWRAVDLAKEQKSAAKKSSKKKTAKKQR